MCRLRWFPVVFFSLFFVGMFAYAQDPSPDAPPMDGAFPGAPPMDGSMPDGGPMKGMKDLMDWKKAHQSDPRVQAFDQSHGDLPHPTPGQAPDPSQFQKVRQYMDDLKTLKKTIDADPDASTGSTSETPVTSVPSASDPNAKTQTSPTQKVEETSVAQCTPTTSAEVQPQADDLQPEIAQIDTDLDPPPPLPSHHFVKAGPLSPDGLPGGFPPGGAPSIGTDPDTQLQMQKNLVDQQVRKIKEQIQDLKDQASDYQDKVCMNPGKGGLPGVPGGAPFDKPPGDAGDKPDFGDGDLPPKPPGDLPGDLDDLPPVGAKMPKPGKGGVDTEALLLDLPDDLQHQLDRTNDDLDKAKERLRTAKKSWTEKCQQQARNQMPMSPGMNGMGGGMMMGGAVGMGGMNMMAGGMGGLGMMGYGGMGMSPMAMMGGMSIGGGMPMMSYGSMGGYNPYMMSAYSSPYYNPYIMMMGGMGYASMMPNYSMNYGGSYGSYGMGYNPYSGNTFASIISALTPLAGMGLSAYSSLYGMSQYYKSYGNYLSSCQTTGVPCSAPMGYGSSGYSGYSPYSYGSYYPYSSNSSYYNPYSSLYGYGSYGYGGLNDNNLYRGTTNYGGYYGISSLKTF